MSTIALFLMAATLGTEPPAYPRAFAVPEREIRGLDVSPDGSRLLLGGEGGGRILDVENGKTLSAPMAGESVLGAGWAPDGKRFVLLLGRALVILGPGGGPRWLLEAKDSAALSAVRWCEDGSIAVSVRKGSGSEVHVYSGPGLKQTLVIPVASGSGALACAARGLAIAAGASIEVYDLGATPPARVRGLQGRAPQSDFVSLTMASKGGEVAALDAAGTVTLWDRSGRIAGFRPSLAERVTAPAQERAASFSPDGGLLAVGEILLHAPSLEIASRVRGADLGRGALAFSRDGERLFATGASSIRVMRIVDLIAPLALPPGPVGELSSAAVDADGSMVAAGTKDGRIEVFDPEKAQPRRVIEAGAGEIQRLEFLPDKRTLLAASGPALHTFDVITGQRLLSAALSDISRVEKVRFNARGKKALIQGSGRAILIDVDALEPKKSFEAPGLIDADLAPDGGRLAVAAEGRAALILDTETKGTVRELPEARAAAFDGTGALVALAQPKRIAVFRLAYGERVADHAIESDAPDRLFFFWGDEIGWWSRSSGVFGFAGRKARQKSPPRPFADLVFDRKKQRVITVGPGSAIALWRASDLAKEGELASGAGARVLGLSFSAEGERLFARGEDGRIRTFDVRGLSPGPDLDPERAPVFQDSSLLTAPSPDKRRTAFAQGSEVFIRDAKTSDVVASLVGHEGPISRIAWSPRGERLATASGDEGDVRLWNPKNGQCLFVWHQR